MMVSPLLAQQRLQHRLEPAWRCSKLMGGGTEDRLRAKSGLTDFRSFLQKHNIVLLL